MPAAKSGEPNVRRSASGQATCRTPGPPTAHVIVEPDPDTNATQRRRAAQVTDRANAPAVGPARRAPATLDDFEPLLPAESQLLRAMRSGRITKLGLRRPHESEAKVHLRGAFLSLLARGGGGLNNVGLQLQIVGACITGRFDVMGSTVPMDLWFYRCLFIAAPRLDRSHIVGSASFSDCAMPGFRAEGCRIDEHLSIHAGCSVEGEIRLARAQIGRDLNCERMQVLAGTTTEHRFVADDMRVGGDVILCSGFESAGEVRFTGAHIGGDLRAAQARVMGAIDRSDRRGVALNLDRARIDGSVHLDSGFSAAGQVRLRQARIAGDLNCAGAAFDVVGDASWGRNQAALLLDRARIGGSLILTQMQCPLQAASLVDARAGTLIDDTSTWGQDHALDGFAYSRLAGDAPTDAATRVEWLERQDPAHLGRDYRPEPWRRLIKVLRRMGRGTSARDVAIERERHLRRVGLIGSGAPRGVRWLAVLAHDLYGLFAGYGHRPMRTIGLLGLVWLLCAGVYWTAAEYGAIGPSASVLVSDPRLADCRPHCTGLPATMTPFQPLLYSLDLLVPLIDLQQERHWAPAPWPATAAVDAVIGMPVVRVLTWFEALFGWLGLLTLLATATGLADRDRRL